MARETLINQLKEDFQFVKKNPAILGVMLYGSHLTDDNTVRSDIDVCIIAPDYNLYEIYQFVMSNLKKHIDDSLIEARRRLGKNNCDDSRNLHLIISEIDHENNRRHWYSDGGDFKMDDILSKKLMDKTP